MTTICFATHNPNKLTEMAQMLPGKYNLRGLTELGITTEIPETGTTLPANSEIKARYVADKLGLPTFADDTGLEVAALNGAPGVYSARYAGEQKNAQANMQRLLNELKPHTNRQAQFVTSICLVINQQAYFFEGVVQGTITQAPQGDGGFGYDPIFVPQGYQKTFAQLSPTEKNKISHRGLAVEKLVNFLTQFSF